MTESELGLIGSGIDRSMAPMLHEALGRLSGNPVRYRLHDIDPTRAGDIADVLETFVRQGVWGVNVTHPFKEVVAGLVTITDPVVRSIGAVNTVSLRSAPATGHNTDYSGFVSAFEHRFGGVGPGVVAQLGAGGVGRAIAFALATLGAEAIRLHDPDRRRAESLAEELGLATGLPTSVHPSPEEATLGGDGLVNCSPIGMHTHPGCPIERAALASPRWVFDAVYAPVRTNLLVAAEQFGSACMTGVELFFWQGVHAFEIFHGQDLSTDVIEAASATVRAEVEARVADGR